MKQTKDCAREREELCPFLKTFRDEKGRLAYLETLVPLLIRRLREMRQDSTAGPRVTQSWSFLPRAGIIADPTGACAARAADLEQSEEYRAVQRRLQALCAERERLRRRVQLADCCLAALGDESRFLVEARLVDGRSWPQTETLYRQRYGVDYSSDTLRRKLRAACRTLENITAGAPGDSVF